MDRRGRPGGLPYLGVGVVWSLVNTDHLAGTDGIRRVLALLGGVAFWPVLLLAQACAL